MEEIVKIEEGQIIVPNEVIKKIVEFNKLKKEVEYQEKLLKDGLMKAMQEVGKERFCIEGLSATICKGSTRTTVDSTRLKNECPDIYKTYSKTSKVAPSLVLTISE